MLFLSDRIHEARNRVISEFETGKLGAETAFRQVLELVPEDNAALAGLAELHYQTDPVHAAELLWRTVQLQPCDFVCYLRLSDFLYRQPAEVPMANALADLAFRKMLLFPDVADELEAAQEIIGMENAPPLAGDNALEKVKNFLDSRDADPAADPADVNEKLRPYRLIHKLQESDDLEPAEVDEMLQAGPALVPLLVGVLRGWAQGLLDEEEDSNLVENTLGLLGELGTTNEIMPLLEFATLEDENLAGAAKWALDRIIARQPDEAARLLRERAPKLPARERFAVLERLVLLPSLDPGNETLVALAENLPSLSREDRSAFVPMYLSSLMLKRGRDGAEMARSVLRRNAALLSNKVRRDCEQLIEDLARNPVSELPEPEPSTVTVYEICGGTADYQTDEELDEDDDGVEPRYREDLPGRNEPCWCGSGKKYKKCHLDSDQEKS